VWAPRGRHAKGRKHGKRCITGKKARHSRGRKCTTYKKVGSFNVNAAAGHNRILFRGRVGGRTLKPGAYRLVAAAAGSKIALRGSS